MTYQWPHEDGCCLRESQGWVNREPLSWNSCTAYLSRHGRAPRKTREDGRLVHCPLVCRGHSLRAYPVSVYSVLRAASLIRFWVAVQWFGGGSTGGAQGQHSDQHDNPWLRKNRRENAKYYKEHEVMLTSSSQFRHTASNSQRAPFDKLATGQTAALRRSEGGGGGRTAARRSFRPAQTGLGHESSHNGTAY